MEAAAGEKAEEQHLPIPASIGVLRAARHREHYAVFRPDAGAGLYLQMLESPEEKSILEQIYLEYRGLMYHVAYEILHNEQDAEDAVHHAFVKIAENIKKITDPVCPKTHSYVVTIVEHQAIDQYRRLQKHPSVELIEEIQGTNAHYEGDNDLTKCILKLPARYREMILLRYHHGYTVREIAKVLGLSLPTAIKLDQRAKSRLKKMCEEEGIL